MDSPKRSLKVVLLHNGKIFASVPVVNSTKLKADYKAITNLA